MEQDSRLLYQFASSAFERVKELDKASKNNRALDESTGFSREIYLSILQKVPQFLVRNNRSIPHLYYFYGAVLYYLNKDSSERELKENAIRLIKKAITDSSTSDSITYLKELLEILLEEKKYTESLTYCYQLIKLQPEERYYYQVAITTLTRLKRLDETVDLYNRLLKVDRYNFEIHTNLGKLHLNRKEYDEAMKMFLKSKELNQQYPENYLYMGKIFLIKSRKALAISNFKAAVARKLYSHERYLKDLKHSDRTHKIPNRRDDDRQTTIFLFECYINLIKSGDNCYSELREAELRLFEKGYMSRENIELIKRRYRLTV